MRRSSMVKLTMLPLLASAAMARAEPPGLTEPALSPPGLTEPHQPDCRVDPTQPDCPKDVHSHNAFSGAIRGGFGGYFAAGGGG